MCLTKEQIEFYRQNGFLVLPDYFRSAEIEVLMAQLPAVFAEDSPRRILEKSGAVRTVFASHSTNEAFRRFSQLARLVAPARQLLESDVYIHQFKINAKVALEGDRWEWHQDFLYWHKEDGMPAPRVLSIALFLHEVNDFNGPMLLIPGSHKEGMLDVSPHEKYSSGMDDALGQDTHGPVWMPTLTADLKYKIDKQTLAKLVCKNNICAAKGRAGFVLFFDGNMFHASANNLSPFDRVSVCVAYNSVENPLRKLSTPRPTFLANRDFSPLETVPDEALLEMRGGSHE
jgi:ectoine hydroxylase